ncbi:MAG: DegV family protein [Clostridia bacterium]|nr:DegV family protein [Clostridia bacterium]
MNNYVILTDSCCDLTKEQLAALGVKSLSLEVIIDGGAPVYNDDVTENIKGFYEKLREKGSVTTSAVSMDRFTEFFEGYLKEGTDVLYLGFSSGLSGTYNAAFVAAQELAEKYPERKVYTVDTLCASLGQGLFVHLAANLKKDGKSIDEVYEWAKEKRYNLCHWLTVDDLFFLKRGGRVSAATAVMGSMLAIKPVLHIDNKGKIINIAKARGRKASLDMLVENMKKTVIDPKNQITYICHGDCIEDAEYVAKKMKEEVGVPEVIIGYTGPVIAAHAGPGVLAIFYLGTER